MSHDPLCPCHGMRVVCCGEPYGWGERECICQCDLIANVRADQRDRDAQEVMRHKQRGYTCDCGGDVNDYEYHLHRSILEAS